MKAIILAAGAGRRMAGMGWSKPKCLLPCPGGTLLGNALSSLALSGVRDLVIVTGFEHEQVEAAARLHGRATFLQNASFSTTNTLDSAWLARDYMAGGFLLLNADVWFHSSVPERLCGRSAEHRSADGVLAVQCKCCQMEEVKVTIDANGRIQRIGKEIAPDRASGEYVGVGYFDAVGAAALVKAMEPLVRSDCGKALFVEAAVDAILAERQIVAGIIAESEAIEIDTPDDYARATQIWNQINAQS